MIALKFDCSHVESVVKTALKYSANLQSFIYINKYSL